MDAQFFTQMTIAFMAGVTAMNVFIHFLQLAAGELKSSSIIGGGQERKGTDKGLFRSGLKKKPYAVVPFSGKAV